MESTGQALRRWRRTRRISLRALGSAINYSYAYLSEIEIGRKRPLPEVIKACDDYLKADGQLIFMAREEDDVNRRKFVGTLASLSLLRAQIDSVLDLDELEQRVDGFASDCVTAPPTVMLDRLTAELASVQERIGTHVHQRERLTRATARMSILIADELNVLGDPSAPQWYETAMRCADATTDQSLRADVRALAAIAPLYGPDPHRAIALAREAQSIGTTRTTGALAETIEAFGLSLRGDLAGAASALDKAERAFGGSSRDQKEASIFGFPERRFRFYKSRTMLRTSGATAGGKACEEALTLYPATMHGDPAILRLDYAAALAPTDAMEACALATTTLERIPSERLGKIYLRTARTVLHAIPPGRHGAPQVQQLDELIRVAAQDRL